MPDPVQKLIGMQSTRTRKITRGRSQKSPAASLIIECLSFVAFMGYDLCSHQDCESHQTEAKRQHVFSILVTIRPAGITPARLKSALLDDDNHDGPLLQIGAKL